MDMFVDGTATLNVAMGSTELLRGLTKDDLISADKWFFNEYRGGRNADAYPHWDWACNYMCTLDFAGTWEEQNEGTTLQIRNSSDDQRNNPANLEIFDSFVYGSKLITPDNHTMTLSLRTHSASDDAPVYYGVQVVDLSAAEPKATLIGGVKTLNSEPYVNREFDLSAYDGKEVIIAIGIFRQQSGDYWKQLVLRTIRFTANSIGDDLWSWLPGTPVEGLSGWQMTMEMVRSTMPHTKNLSPECVKSVETVTITSPVIVNGVRKTMWLPTGRSCLFRKILRSSPPKAILSRPRVGTRQ